MFEPRPKPGAGQYQRRVTVQRPSKTTGDDGQVQHTWTAYGTFWAKLEPLTGSEETENRRQTPEQGYRVTFRSSPETRAITSEMRLRLDDGTILGITARHDVGSERREVEVRAIQAKP